MGHFRLDSLSEAPANIHPAIGACAYDGRLRYSPPQTRIPSITTQKPQYFDALPIRERRLNVSISPCRIGRSPEDATQMQERSHTVSCPWNRLALYGKGFVSLAEWRIVGGIGTTAQGEFNLFSFHESLRYSPRRGR